MIDAKTQALIDALRNTKAQYKLHIGPDDAIANATLEEADKALAAFAPEPEMVYGPMPEWEAIYASTGYWDKQENCAYIRFPNGECISEKSYNALRELTSIHTQPQGRDFWLTRGGYFLSEQDAYNHHMAGPPPIHVREVLDEKP